MEVKTHEEEEADEVPRPFPADALAAGTGEHEEGYHEDATGGSGGVVVVWWFCGGGGVVVIWW